MGPRKTTTGENDGLKSLSEIGLSKFLPYLVNRVASSWNMSLQSSLRKDGLNTVRMRTLAVLTVSDGISIKELIDLAVVEQSTISRALDAMEEQGLIERIASEADKRIRTIYITDKGRKVFEDFWPSMFNKYQHLMNGVSEEEQDALMGTLNKILDNLDEPSGS